MTLQADMRAAAVTLLEGYKATTSAKLQVYRARPLTLIPPTAFVDSMSERIDYVGISLRQRTPLIEVVVVHGAFDSGEAVDQRDVFVDGFLDYCATLPHAGGANTLVGPVRLDDDPNYVPDWLPPEKQSQYYATRITLEGYAEN